MSGGQRGSIIVGVWLVALGAVFLLQQALDLPWSRAWPLFVIMAGAGTGASALVGLAGRRIGAWSVLWTLVWPAVVIAVGTLLFLDFAGLADIDAFGLLARWWPVALIAAGLLVLLGAAWPRGRGIEDRLSVSTDGAPDGEVVLKFSGGRLDVGKGTAGELVGGTFEGGVRRRDLGPGRVELEADLMQVWPFGDRLHWRMGLAPDLPLSLRVEGGAAKGDLDLADLQVRRLEVKTGASDTRIVLPRTVDRCAVRIEAGAAQVRVEVPAGVAARIRSQMGLGTTSVDEARFPRTGDGWASRDLDTSRLRVEIQVRGGVGTVRIA